MVIQGFHKVSGPHHQHTTYIDRHEGDHKMIWGQSMKIVVLGGSGLIGTNIVSRLRHDGHDVVAASRRTGVNCVTRKGLARTLTDTDVVVDVMNSPSFEDFAVMGFFETSSRNVLAAEAAAGVKHHLAVSVVGNDRLPESGYLRAKKAQENLIKASKIPYTILRSTQFYEFITGIIHASVDANMIRLSPALIQPIASDDVAAILADLVVSSPENRTLEVAGPEQFPLDELVRIFLVAHENTQQVIADVHARYFGAELNDKSLLPFDHYIIGSTRFNDWLKRGSLRL